MAQTTEGLPLADQCTYPHHMHTLYLEPIPREWRSRTEATLVLLWEGPGDHQMVSLIVSRACTNEGKEAQSIYVEGIA
jgi:hypothetical protein